MSRGRVCTKCSSEIQEVERKAHLMSEGRVLHAMSQRDLRKQTKCPTDVRRASPTLDVTVGLENVKKYARLMSEGRV